MRVKISDLRELGKVKEEIRLEVKFSRLRKENEHVSILTLDLEEISPAIQEEIEFIVPESNSLGILKAGGLLRLYFDEDKTTVTIED